MSKSRIEWVKNAPIEDFEPTGEFRVPRKNDWFQSELDPARALCAFRDFRVMSCLILQPITGSKYQVPETKA